MLEPVVVHGQITDEVITKWSQKIVEFINDVFGSSHEIIDETTEQRYGDKSYWILITLDQRILALCTIEFDEERNLGFIYNFSVHKYQRRIHLGTMLVHNIKSIFPCHDFYGLVRHDNQKAIQFYNKMGIRRCRRLVNLDDTMYEEYRFYSRL